MPSWDIVCKATENCLSNVDSDGGHWYPNTQLSEAMSTYIDKFVAFVDILGFKDMVADSVHHGQRLGALLDLVIKLGDGTERSNYEKYGPICCPESPRIARNLDFRVTQISDCVIVSAEISPAGLINLVTHCWQVAIRLLQLGVLCRGFISRGLIYHTDTQVIGPGYQDTYRAESTVSAFRNRADEVGTPFIEIDEGVVKYVSVQEDGCVKMMFDRLTKFDGSKVALYPFKRLNHHFLIGGISGPFDQDVHLTSVNNIRGWIGRMKVQIMANVMGKDSAATRKAEHYIEALGRQLIELDKTEQIIRSIPQGTL